MLGTGDAIWFSDGHGNPVTPPHNMKVAAGSPNAGVVDEVENPNPLQGHQQLVHRRRLWRRFLRLALLWRRQLQRLRRYFAAGRRTIVDYLKRGQGQAELPGRALLPAQQLQSRLLRRRHQRLCRHQKSAEHRVHRPAVDGSETSATCCCKKNITFAYFGDQFNAYLANPYNNMYPDNQYCNICNFFQYSTSIMTNAPVRNMASQGYARSLRRFDERQLPAVSFVKPSGYLDGHPASSKLDLLEGFVKKIVDVTKANQHAVGKHGDLHHHG